MLVDIYNIFHTEDAVKFIVTNIGLLICLTRSERTSVMTTPKRPGAHFWQICRQMYPLHQSSIDALHTITSNLADLPPIN